LQFHPGQGAVHTRIEQFDEIVFQPREINLGFRITEPCVEFEDLWTLPGQNHSRIKYAAKIDALRCATPQPGVENRAAGGGELGVA